MRRRPAPRRRAEAALPVDSLLAPEALEIERRRLLHALDALTAGVVVVDAEGGEVMRNGAADRFRDPRHADALTAQVLDELLAEALHGTAREHELSLFGPPREVLLISAAPLLDGADLIGAVAFVHDISEARRVESVRRDFVANVSHELKTPVGALALLAETIASADDVGVIHPLADQLVREADRLGRIVDDLLDLSLIEAQEAPTRERVPVRVLLEEAADRLGPMALAHGIPLRVLEAPDELEVRCDAAQIVSAITNLLDNAVKYSEQGQPVELGAVRDGARAVISVRDHGIGIPSGDLERIFERFYRVDRARSRATGGTGLGLAIVRHVAQAHGGDVTVESIEGEGSTFRLMLPLAEESAAHAPAETAEAS